MKKLLIFLGLCWITFSVSAQIDNPVHWSFSAEKINDTEANLKLTASIDAGWHIYSLNDPGEGLIPTSFKFNKSKDFSLIGETLEPKSESAFDKNLKMQISWHSGKVVFIQKIKFSNPATVVSGVLEYVVCNDFKCLPPEEVKFKIPLDKSSGETADIANTAPNPEDNTSAAAIAAESSKSQSTISSPEGDIASSQSLFGIFIAEFIGGLAAFFMPCIYPMIPLTISYFTKKSGSRAKAVQSAFVYGLSIIAIYVSLGLLVTFLFGASALNEAASSATFNLLFFVMLVIFAISFLGAFEITLPSSLVNKADEKSNSGGLIGLFFMAFTLALVSFSCTGPIIGYLLVDTVSKGTYLGPAVGMFGFSFALAIPFTLFATFPSWLKELPKSGSWLNTVKVSLGFLELALALKFLSNVDLAYHWNIFDRDIFLVIWIIIFGMLGLYLLGKIHLSDDDNLRFLSLPRLFISMIVLAFSVYMVPGLWGAPLKGISAWLPPQSTQDFDLFSNASSSGAVQQTAGKKYSNLFHAPHGLDAFYDYEQGLDYAKKANKPVLIDFTGWSCTNCRKMEASVWSDPGVLKRLKEDYVLISLYVDDKTELPENEKYITGKGKKIKNIGQKWSDFEASRFNINSQPFYVIVDPEGNNLVPPQAFNLDINNYIQFLDSGKKAFSK
ncbi:MAG TPA: disulfide bond formation protein DsbD [Sphingobacteriaceae bacterium]|nr:disulfide bond formation protein DsbD [Sphingobacteriaceae bacterium]